MTSRNRATKNGMRFTSRSFAGYLFFAGGPSFSLSSSNWIAIWTKWERLAYLPRLAPTTLSISRTMDSSQEAFSGLRKFQPIQLGLKFKLSSLVAVFPQDASGLKELLLIPKFGEIRNKFRNFCAGKILLKSSKADTCAKKLAFKIFPIHCRVHFNLLPPFGAVSVID